MRKRLGNVAEIVVDDVIALVTDHQTTMRHSMRERNGALVSFQRQVPNGSQTMRIDERALRLQRSAPGCRGMVESSGYVH